MYFFQIDSSSAVFEVLKNTRLAPTKKGLGGNFVFCKKDGLVIEVPHTSPKRYRLSRKGIEYLTKYTQNM